MRSVFVLSCVLLFVPPSVAGPPPEDLADAYVQVEEWTDMAPQPRDVTIFKSNMLRDHNLVRHNFGVRALVWDEGLAADATNYARTLAVTKRFQHAVRIEGKPVHGENLWMGTRSAYRYQDMTGSWIEEARDFTSGIFPRVSRTGSWHDVGHYTQMIWSDTRSVGCGMAANDEDEVLVCRYFPAGNVFDEPLIANQKTAATSLANASAR